MNWKTRSQFWRPALLGVAVIGGGAGLAAAADSEPDKSRYHLFNPTPRDQMRELSTDRPDQTESAYTVDAGHFQIEMDVANGTIDHDQSNGGDVRSQVWNFGGLNLKAGLLNNVDLQVVLDGYVDSRVEDRVANQVADDSGFGEVQTRLKINLWGNDGGKTALAIMPFVKWPLSESSLRNGQTEGGIIVPWAVQLPAGWGMGGITEFDFVSDGSGGRDTEYFNTLTLSHDIYGKLAGYIEIAALITPESGDEWRGQIDVGFTYGLDEDTQFDFGCNFGVTESAPDYNPFAGLTVRF